MQVHQLRNWAVTSLPLREVSRVVVPSEARARWPSHFTSNDQPGSSNGVSNRTASIGSSSGGGAGCGSDRRPARKQIQFRPEVRTKWYSAPS